MHHPAAHCRSAAPRQRSASVRLRRRPSHWSSAKPSSSRAEYSADYIHLYSGDTKTLAESLEPVQRASSEILAAIMPTD
jgi:hypothetical protein